MKRFAILTGLFLFVVSAWAALSPAERAALELQRTELEGVVSSRPDVPDLWRRLGFAYQGLGEVERARGAFQRLVELRPKDAPGWYMLALSHEKLKEPALALDAWRKCLRHSKDPEMSGVAMKHIAFLEGS